MLTVHDVPVVTICHYVYVHITTRFAMRDIVLTTLFMTLLSMQCYQNHLEWSASSGMSAHQQYRFKEIAIADAAHNGSCAFCVTGIFSLSNRPSAVEAYDHVDHDAGARPCKRKREQHAPNSSKSNSTQQHSNARAERWRQKHAERIKPKSRKRQKKD